MRIPQPAAPTGGGLGGAGSSGGSSLVWISSMAASAGGVATLPVAIQRDYRVYYILLTVTAATGAATTATPTDTIYTNQAIPAQTWDKSCIGSGAFALGGYYPPRLVRASSGENLIIVATSCNAGDILTARVEYA